MEEFVMILEESMKDKPEKFLANRKLLNIILSNNPPEIIEIKSGEDIGDLYFSVSLKDIGIDMDILMEHQKELFSTFLGNTLGEFFIRENIDMFAEILTSLEVDDYVSTVNSWTHKKFGVEIDALENRIVFNFHVSLLQKILTEDLRERI
jgi:hypothetical protein